MSGESEIELKFLVPRDARAALLAEVTRRPANLERRSLAAMYLDTPDRRLAAAGIAWRLRREGRRWVQTLKAGGASAIERFEHEVIRPGPRPDMTLHGGTRVGDKLAKILRNAHVDGLEVGVRFKTEVRRMARRIRSKGAVVEVAFDEGALIAQGRRLRLREVEFELLSGSPLGLLALAERWRKRFGLVFDPRSKAERGDRLADGWLVPPLRKAARPVYARDASVIEAFGRAMDECLAHMNHSAIGLVDGGEDLRVEHVHQLRVGIRRLRSALRSFRGWVPSPPDELVDQLKELFADMGRTRDSDVLESGIAADLENAGAPSLTMTKGEGGPDPVATISSARTQEMLLGWLAWRVALAEVPSHATASTTAVALDAGDAASRTAVEVARVAVSGAAVEGIAANEARQAAFAGGMGAVAEEQSADAAAEGAIHEPMAPAALRPDQDHARSFQRQARRRLRNWHRQIAAARKTFDGLEEVDLHSLRKRIKRQRYAVEFFAPVLRRRDVDRYLKPLMSIQDRMGELNDLFVARKRYQALLATDPAAWFALGWLAARIAEVRRLAKTELKVLAKADPPA